jgi:hypothetical protein
MPDQDDEIQKIVSDRLPNMQVVKRKRVTKSVAQPDAELPRLDPMKTAGRRITAPVTAGTPADSPDADDDVVLVNLEPRTAAAADAPTARNQVALVSRKKKKVVVLRG